MLIVKFTITLTTYVPSQREMVWVSENCDVVVAHKLQLQLTTTKILSPLTSQIL